MAEPYVAAAGTFLLLFLVGAVLYRSRAVETGSDSRWALSAFALALGVALFVPVLGFALRGSYALHPEDALVPLFSVAGGLSLLGVAVGAWATSAFLKNLPVSPAGLAHHGFVRLWGRVAASHGLLYSTTGSVPCVYFGEEWEEYRRKTRTTRDSQGNTRTETYYQWDTVHTEFQAVAFTLTDDSGGLVVQPDRATWRPTRARRWYNGLENGGPSGWLGGASVGDVRITVRYIEEGEVVHVLGRLKNGKVGYCTYRKLLDVDTGDGQAAAGGRTAAGFVSVIGAVVLLVAGVGWPFLASGMVRPNPDDLFAMPGTGPISADLPMRLAPGLAGLGVFLGAAIWRFRNQLVALKAEVANARASIDIPLKERADLIPNLVAAAKGAADHEREALVRVSELRSGGLGDQFDLSRELPPLLARLEATPRLRASEAFLRVQEGLVAVENRIEDARETYNAAAADYNEAREVWPTRWVAAMVGGSDAPVWRE